MVIESVKSLQVYCAKRKARITGYEFDKVFDSGNEQATVYTECFRKYFVEELAEQKSSTIFLFGPTQYDFGCLRC